jgi:hypothetical protein|tara:strand:+ start:4613 stop:5203 length:591 start_codon:yes stop_codon:yes gene_type:complete
MVTSTKANSPVDIASRALILIGAEPITSFGDGTTESLITSNLYEDIAQTALVNARWRFATNQSVLNLLTDAPTGRYDKAYQLPTDTLMVHAVTINDNVVDYQIYGDKIYADTTDNDIVIADYSYRANEVDWPSYFSLAVEYALAVPLSFSLARDASLGSLMQQQATALMAKARSIDSQQQTSRKLITSRFLTNRRS